MDSNKQWNFIEKALSDRQKAQQLRSLHPLNSEGDGVFVEREGTRLINFCSNDYLGLSKHPFLIKRSQKFAEQYGVGATASRLISGTYKIHEKLEEKLASSYQREAALLFNTGFQANSTILQALTDRNSLILSDKNSHNSLLQGSLLSRARFQRFEHNDLGHLQKLLERAASKSYNRILIVTETVFSMDGDRGDLDAIIDLADQYNAMLFVDDAHAVGVWGEKGLGLTFQKPGIDIALGTFGKAFGVFGAFITCSSQMRDYLINFCSGFIYTTALPPPVIGALDAAVELVPQMERERNRYHRGMSYLKQEIEEAGFDTGKSSTQIIPVIIGDERKTLELSRYLENNGILATAIRPPTVPESGSRIRITLSMKHTTDHVNQLIRTLRGWNEG